MSQEKKLNYSKLALAVCGGILLATLISNAIEVYWFNKATEQQLQTFDKQMQSLSSKSRETTERLERQAAQQQAAQQQATQRQRGQSTIGQKLSRECAEYSDFYRNQPGEYAREQRDKACKKYRVFMESGKVTN